MWPKCHVWITTYIIADTFFLSAQETLPKNRPHTAPQSMFQKITKGWNSGVINWKSTLEAEAENPSDVSINNFLNISLGKKKNEN